MQKQRFKRSDRPARVRVVARRVRIPLLLLTPLVLSWLSAGSAAATCALCTPVDSVRADVSAANQPVINTPLSSAG